MTPGARAQASIDLLDILMTARKGADDVAGIFFKRRRYIGAKDRRAVRDLVHDVARRRAQLDWWLQRAGVPVDRVPSRARVLAALLLVQGWTESQVAEAFDGGPYRPAALAPEERRAVAALTGRPLAHPEQPSWVSSGAPEWLEPALRRAFGERHEAEMEALNRPAPVDLRVNTLVGTREQALAMLRQDGLHAEPTPLSPVGIRLAGHHQLGAYQAFWSGLVEVQDEGSQILALLLGAKPGERVCDFCSGAGGKALALAAQMRNTGRIVACDVSAPRLERAGRRLRRAGVHAVEQRVLSSERDRWVKRAAGTFDRVLVDAPCSGTGTWRRRPESRWRLPPERLPLILSDQRRILDSAARLPREGGRLVYATCSVLREENEDQVASFLERTAGFEMVPVSEAWAECIGGACPCPDPCLRLSPARHGVDGFFAAVLRRTRARSVATRDEDEAS
jgi:16S rRNA (cytosine967-C5)-methyltransferase